jgi:Caspase domain
MRRRPLLVRWLYAPLLGRVWSTHAQPIGAARVAIAIGIDKAGDLPVLRGASAGAREVGTWLKGEGFEVKLFADDIAPVKAGNLFDTIDAVTRRGTTQQLVIYFAGHGVVNGYSEYWLLSQAPDNPNEAINLRESVTLARYSPIPHVVFISDACRSRADSLRAERLYGTLLFPVSRSAPANLSKVDQFLATHVGDPSWEVPAAESTSAYEGIYTRTFLDAYRHPDANMVRKIESKEVVPNIKLEKYLDREVPARAERVSIKYRQRPDTQVTSGEESYIGRVLLAAVSGAASAPATGPMDVVVTVAAPAGVPVARGATDAHAAAASEPTRGDPRSAPEPVAFARASPEARPIDVRDVANQQLARVNLGLPSDRVRRVGSAEVDRVAKISGFENSREKIAVAQNLGAEVLTRTGFLVAGARLSAVTSSSRALCKIVNAPQDRDGARVEVDLRGQRGASVALRFSDGSGTLLAALDGFIGNVVVDDAGVSSVSYFPSRASPMYDIYRQEQGRINELHAVVATSARYGAFRIEGPAPSRERSAAEIASRIRMLKGIDPTLGIYAAYAYADGGLLKDAKSVHGYMRGDLGIDLFDVAMLALVLFDRVPGSSDGPVPFAPMLSQGWSLLRAYQARIPDEVLVARDHLRPSLWSTFGPQGMKAIEAAIMTERYR